MTAIRGIIPRLSGLKMTQDAQGVLDLENRVVFPHDPARGASVCKLRRLRRHLGQPELQ
jgi:hypothetical protein